MQNLSNVKVVIWKKVENMATKIAKPARSAMQLAFAKWAYGISYFPELGLRYDDRLDPTPEVAEAIRRLPKDLQDERMFRITRALELSTKKTTLPKAEWTQFEKDERYLLPYLEEVKKENREKAEWNSK